MSEVENKSESISGEERVKKEEFHVEVKTKDTKPNDVVEEKMELELKTKSVEKEKPKRKEDQKKKHKEGDEEKSKKKDKESKESVKEKEKEKKKHEDGEQKQGEKDEHEKKKKKKEKERDTITDEEQKEDEEAGETLRKEGKTKEKKDKKDIEKEEKTKGKIDDKEKEKEEMKKKKNDGGSGDKEEDREGRKSDKKKKDKEEKKKKHKDEDTEMEKETEEDKDKILSVKGEDKHTGKVVDEKHKEKVDNDKDEMKKKDKKEKNDKEKKVKFKDEIENEKDKEKEDDDEEEEEERKTKKEKKEKKHKGEADKGKEDKDEYEEKEEKKKKKKDKDKKEKKHKDEVDEGTEDGNDEKEGKKKNKDETDGGKCKPEVISRDIEIEENIKESEGGKGKENEKDGVKECKEKKGEKKEKGEKKRKLDGKDKKKGKDLVKLKQKLEQINGKIEALLEKKADILQQMKEAEQVDVDCVLFVSAIIPTNKAKGKKGQRHSPSLPPLHKSNQIKSKASKMENSEKESSMATSKQYGFSNGHSPRSPNHSSWFEIRLFYVRVAPCVIDSVPDHLTLRHLRREIGVSLEINNSRIPASESASLTLRRDRLDKESSEVTYVSTDTVRVTGGVDFEVYENQELVLCGSLEPVVANWLNGSVSSDNDAKTGWTMDCYMAASIGSGSSAFFQPKLGVSAPSFEVYIAGCCSGVPVILTKTIQISPRRKVLRHAVLDAIPEDEEIGKEQRNGNGLVRHRKVQFTESEVDDYEPNGKINHGFYSEEMYPGEDGQLSWFNAGVRVGVGIGLGMCLGIGIGVGLLMRSYQATTSNFRRRFL